MNYLKELSKSESTEEKQIHTSSGHIAYYSAEESINQPTFVFIHGNSSSKETFKNQYLHLIDHEYSFIALDLPGHGHSSWDSRANNSNIIYSIPYYANIIKNTLDSISIQKPILVGHSLGGHIAIHLSHLIDSLGLFTFQAPPLEASDDIAKAFCAIDGLNELFSDKIHEIELIKLMTAFFRNHPPSDELLQIFKSTDPACRKNIAQSLAPGIKLNEVSILNQLKVPHCILLSTEDPLINKEYLNSLKSEVFYNKLWNGKFNEISQSGHYPQLDQPKLFNEILIQFAKGCLSA